MFCPMTLLSNVSGTAANGVVVRLHSWSRIMVPAEPFLISDPAESDRATDQGCFRRSRHANTYRRVDAETIPSHLTAIA
jgi:hypothetical protein